MSKLTLVAEIAHLVSSGNLNDIDELLANHIENCGQYKAEIIAGRRRYLQDTGREPVLPQLAQDSLQFLREFGSGYQHVTKPNVPLSVNRISQQKKRRR